MLISLLRSRPCHEDLASITTVGGVQVIDLPATADERIIDVTLLCRDGASLAVHYHNPQTLLSAIRTNTLNPALIRLKSASAWAYLVVGGVMVPNADGKIRLGKTSTGVSWDVVQQALMTAQEMGVTVLTLPHADSVPTALLQLAIRPRTAVRALPLRDGLFYEPGMQVLLGLPGISEAKAEALLDHCGTAATALLALTSAYTSVPGLAPDLQTAVRTALGLPDGMALLPTKETDLTLYEKVEIASTTNGGNR